MPREPGSAAAASLAPAPSRRGRGPARRQLWAPAACRVRPRAPLASRSPPARSPPARAHTRASHTAAPRTAPPRTPRSVSPAAAPGRSAQSRPRPPRPISPGSAPRFSGQRPPGPSGEVRGGQGPRAGERLAPATRRAGESRAVPAPQPTRSAAGTGRRGRRARGGGRGAAAAPGGSPTRGSCCLNAGALPSRRSPRPAQPRPPGAPVPCVPGRCSLPRERRDWSARAEPPSPTRSAAARLTAEALGREKCVLSTGDVCRLLGVRGKSSTLWGSGRSCGRVRDLLIRRRARPGAGGLGRRGGECLDLGSPKPGDAPDKNPPPGGQGGPKPDLVARDLCPGGVETPGAPSRSRGLV